MLHNLKKIFFKAVHFLKNKSTCFLFV